MDGVEASVEKVGYSLSFETAPSLSETLIYERGPCCRPGVYSVSIIGASDAVSSAELRSVSVCQKEAD
jgi:hypothetical protein